MHVLELTRRLIEIPSVSGEEKALAEFLADYLSRAGFAIELQEAEANRPNLYARRGEAQVVLSSHTDTVPPYVEFREDEQTIYGRGACDAKGILADLRGMQWPVDATLGPWTLNIGIIKGGIATNVIAPEAEAELLFRIVTDAATVKRLFEATVNGRAAIDYSFACDAVFMEALEGFETEVVAFTTDIPLLTNWGKPLLFGPGSILDAHTEHERISKTELLRAVDVYAEMVTTLKVKIADDAPPA